MTWTGTWYEEQPSFSVDIKPSKQGHKTMSSASDHAVTEPFVLAEDAVFSLIVLFCLVFTTFRICLPEGGLQTVVSPPNPLPPNHHQCSCFVSPFSLFPFHGMGGVQTKPIAQGDREAPGEIRTDW